MKKRKYSKLNIEKSRLRWNKKGQFFLIAAIIIIIMILFSIIVKYNTIKQTVALEDFKELSEGYSTEQPKVINLAIAEGGDEGIALGRFTKEYVDYSKEREPSFGVFYAYRDSRGNLHLVNSLSNNVLNIQFQNVNGEQASLQLIPGGTSASGTIGLNIGGQQFGTTVTTDISNYGKQISEAELKDVQIDFIQVIIPTEPRPTIVTIPAGCWSGNQVGSACLDVYQNGYDLGTVKATLETY